MFYQHLIAVPIDMNVPKVPPPCNITFPTLDINSLPRSPILKKKVKTMHDVRIPFYSSPTWS